MRPGLVPIIASRSMIPAGVQAKRTSVISTINLGWCSLRLRLRSVSLGQRACYMPVSPLPLARSFVAWPGEVVIVIRTVPLSWFQSLPLLASKLAALEPAKQSYEHKWWWQIWCMCPGIGQVPSVSPSRLPLEQAWPPSCAQPSARGSGQKLATLLQIHPARILHVLRTRSTEFAAKAFAPAPARPSCGEGDLGPARGACHSPLNGS